MSTEHIHRLSTSSTSSISATMSIDDIHILSTSPASSTSTSSNTNVSTFSSSSNTNVSTFSSSSNTNVSSSSSSNSISYSSERICYLLKHEQQQYDIVDNKASSAVDSYWSIFGFPAKLNKETGRFERIMGFTSCHKCKKTFVYGPHSETTHMKQ
ncbi:unnamed protein product, partial [Rotaria sp. Silwood2]